jgi:hypothetical protein
LRVFARPLALGRSARPRARAGGAADTGIYSWDYLYELGRNYVSLWDTYLKRMEEAGAKREPVAGAAAFELRPKAK